MVKIHTKPKLKNPVLIAAWPGMGSVAFKTVSYLIEKLPAKEFAEIPSGEYYSPTAITAKDSIIQLPYFPTNKFYYYSSKKSSNDIVFFLGGAQPSSSKQYELAEEIINMAKKLDVKLIYTLAGMLIYKDEQEDLKVWGVATDSKLIDKLRAYKIKPMRGAYISGLNGLLLGVAKEAEMPGICLLGELPFYAIQIEYTPSCLAVLEVLADMLNVKIDIEEMENASASCKGQIQRIIAHLRKTLTAEAEGGQDEAEIEESDLAKRIEKELGISSEVPDYVKNKIDKLFSIAKKDTSKAYELKALLDKWELFKYYEDRFLDLFKKENQ
jgi:proteasome assembly chaperone (PAC2) family protein